jgi:predicted RNA-binding Zn-ribbon protein involved in translation (DUF1610 family)
MNAYHHEVLRCVRCGEVWKDRPKDCRSGASHYYVISTREPTNEPPSHCSHCGGPLLDGARHVKAPEDNIRGIKCLVLIDVLLPEKEAKP